jgi:hypothetical protein
MHVRPALIRGLAGLALILLTASVLGCAKRSVPAQPVAVYTGPVLEAVVPPSGDVSGSTLVTVYGTRLSAPPQSVEFGAGSNATALTGVSTGSTMLTPAGSAGTVDVILVNLDGQGSTLPNGFTYLSTTTSPTISAISPTPGPEAGNDLVTITGTNFATTGTVSVWIGANAASSITVVNATTITARTPAGVANTTVNVAMQNPDGGSATLVDSYQYVKSAVVQGINPAVGHVSGGTTVTITGRNFINATSANLGGLNLTNLTVVNDSTITGDTAARTAGVAVVDITVIDPLGIGTLVNGFTYTDTPTIASIAPFQVLHTGGATVTITGTKFVQGVTVDLEGTLLTNVNVVNTTTITGDAPAHVPAELDVTVTNPGNLSATLTDGFYYIYPDTHNRVGFVWDTSTGIDHRRRWLIETNWASFRTDLASEGLQTATASDPVNKYVEDWITAYICQGVNIHFGRNGDGTKISSSSINATFICVAPATGTAGGNGANDYSRMCIGGTSSSGGGVLGTAWFDGGNPCGNSSEDDCLGAPYGGSGSTLGVFTASFGAPGSFPSPALSQADQKYFDGSVTTGARYTAIHSYLLNWAYRIAYVTAHEIGHSVGLVGSALTGSCGSQGQCSATGGHNNCCNINIMRASVNFSSLNSFTARAFSGQPGGVTSSSTCWTTTLSSWAMLQSYLGTSP